MLSILFCGTGDIAMPAFELLLNRADTRLLGLVTQPDKPFGRKQILTPPAIKALAQSHGLPVWQPEKLRDFVLELRLLAPDLIVVMAYGQILSKRTLAVPRIACLNLHASLLPRHRGAAPIQAAIASGDSETGVTVIYMDAGLDTGDILLMEKTPIHPDETGGSLHDRLAGVAATALARALDAIASGTAPRAPQEHARATHMGKLERSHGQLDWSQPAATLERLIRAYDPWPGTHTALPPEHSGRQIKVFPPVQICDEGKGGKPGEILSADGDVLVVAAGDGKALAFKEIQAEGRARMSFRAFANGVKLAPGQILE